MMHYFFTLPYLVIILHFIPHYLKIKILAIFFISIFLNLPLINGLSFNDLSFSFIGNLSFVSLAFCLIIFFQNLQNKKHLLISTRGYLVIFLVNFIFFLSFLHIIPFNLYYANLSITLPLMCLLIICIFIIDKILGLVYLLALFAYTIKLFDSKNIFDYFFDVANLIIPFFILLNLFSKKFLIKHKKSK